MKILGKLFFCIIILFAAYVGFMSWQTNTIGADAQAYLDSALPAIAGEWNGNELWNRASAALRAKMSKQEMDALFSKRAAAFGSMRSYDGIVSVDGRRGLFGSGGDTASCIAKATFVSGRATFSVLLVKSGGAWQIDDFDCMPVSEPVSTPNP